MLGKKKKYIGMENKTMATEKKKMGRPPVSRYQFKNEYCEKLITLGRSGGTIAMFCADVGIYKDLFYEWVETYPEFKDAKRLHESFWEAYSDKIGVAAQAGKIKNFNLGVWVWNRKNKLKERDRSDIHTTTNFKPVVVELNDGRQLELKMTEERVVSFDQIAPTSESGF